MSLSDEERERYARQMLLPAIGMAGQERLKQAHVLVVGAGGLGAPLLQQLAAGGVGHIGLVDPDHVSLSNLPRQILYAAEDCGLYKVDAAAWALQRLAPCLSLRVWRCRADAAFLDTIAADYPIICDGSDNAITRLAVSDACVRHGRTLVSGAVQGFGGQYAVFRPQTGEACYRCLYPEVERAPEFPCAAAGVASIGGVIGPATSVMGSFMAMEVFREILGLEGADHPTRLVLWDGLSSSMRSFPVPRDPACCAPHPS